MSAMYQFRRQFIPYRYYALIASWFICHSLIVDSRNPTSISGSVHEQLAEIERDLELMRLSSSMNSVGLPVYSDECDSTFKFVSSKYLYDRTGDLTFCENHQKLTCCTKSDTSLIRRAINKAENVSPECKNFLSVVLCGRCDALVGLGVRLRNGKMKICQSLCNRWYNACLNDYFEQDGIADSGNPDFSLCSRQSLICWRLSSITSSAEQFCSSCGVVVATSEDPFCFDGEPSAARLPHGKRRPGRFSSNESYSGRIATVIRWSKSPWKFVLLIILIPIVKRLTREVDELPKDDECESQNGSDNGPDEFSENHITTEDDNYKDVDDSTVVTNKYGPDVN